MHTDFFLVYEMHANFISTITPLMSAVVDNDDRTTLKVAISGCIHRFRMVTGQRLVLKWLLWKMIGEITQALTMLTVCVARVETICSWKSTYRPWNDHYGISVSTNQPLIKKSVFFFFLIFTLLVYLGSGRYSFTKVDAVFLYLLSEKWNDFCWNALPFTTFKVCFSFLEFLNYARWTNYNLIRFPPATQYAEKGMEDY